MFPCRVACIVFDHASSEAGQRLEAEEIKKQNGHTRSDE